MKYFSINYWYKTLLPILLFSIKETNSKTKNVNTVSVININKTNLCIYESGHALMILKSSVDKFGSVEINDKKKELIMGKLRIQTFSLRLPSNISCILNVMQNDDILKEKKCFTKKELLQTIRSLSGGEAAELQYGIFNYAVSKGGHNYKLDALEYYDELAKRNELNNESFEQLWNKTRTSAQKIIKKNNYEFELLIKNCEIISTISKSQIEYIMKNRKVSPEINLMENIYIFENQLHKLNKKINKKYLKKIKNIKHKFIKELTNFLDEEKKYELDKINAKLKSTNLPELNFINEKRKKVIINNYQTKFEKNKNKYFEEYPFIKYKKIKYEISEITNNIIQIKKEINELKNKKIDIQLDIFEINNNFQNQPSTSGYKSNSRNM